MYQGGSCSPWGIHVMSSMDEDLSERKLFVVRVEYKGDPLSREVQYGGKLYPAGLSKRKVFEFRILHEKVTSVVLDFDGYLTGIDGKKYFMNLPKEVRNMIILKTIGRKDRRFAREWP